jgi:hypothetical protein
MQLLRALLTYLINKYTAAAVHRQPQRKQSRESRRVQDRSATWKYRVI